MLMNSEDRYGVVSRALHWVMAILILALIAVGIYMTGLDEEDPVRGQVYALHKATGASVFMLVVVRIIWHRISTKPPLPATISNRDMILAKSVHGIFYLLMLLVPFSGYAMSTFAGYKVSFYGLFDMPMLFEKDKALGGIAHEAHEIMAYILLALIVLHVAGVLKHRYFDLGQNDVLKRMT